VIRSAFRGFASSLRQDSFDSTNQLVSREKQVSLPCMHPLSERQCSMHSCQDAAFAAISKKPTSTIPSSRRSSSRFITGLLISAVHGMHRPLSFPDFSTSMFGRHSAASVSRRFWSGEKKELLHQPKNHAAFARSSRILKWHCCRLPVTSRTMSGLTTLMLSYPHG